MSSPDEIKRMTKLEITGLNDIHNRIVTQCYQKCIKASKNDQLEVGEIACLDRCVPKYFEAHGIVQEEFQKLNAARQATPQQ